MRDSADYRQAVEALSTGEGAGHLAAPDAKIILWSHDGSRVLWTSPEASALCSDLTDAAGDPTPFVREHLADLARRLVTKTGFRIERLRFSPSRLVSATTCACKSIEIGSERVLLTAIVGPLPHLRRRTRPDAPEPASDTASPDTQARLASMRERGRQRFVWQADAEGRFTFVSDTLADVVGASHADILGQRWDDIAGRLVEDPDGELSRLFARHETWSGRTVLWRIEGTDQAAPVDLAGIPAIGAGREVLGFRGFGVIRTDAMTPIATPPPPAAPPVRADPKIEAEPVPEEPLRRPVDDGADRAAAPSRPAAESVMPASMPAIATDDRFGSLTARIGGKLGTPRPVPLRSTAAAPAVPDPDTGRLSRLTERAERATARRDAAAGGLSVAERHAFREIARALNARPAEPDTPDETRPSPPAGAEEAAPDAAPFAADPGASDARLRELSAILDTVSDGVIVIDAGARILSLNRSAEALFGFDQRQVAGDRLTALFASESHAAVLDYFAGLQREGVASLLNDGRDLTGRVRQGGTFPLAMTIGRIGDSGSERFCVVLRDVTAQKLVERDLMEARASADEAGAQKADFLATVSHELRTPLNAVIGFTEIMLEERFGPIGNDRYRDYLSDIRQAGGQVVKMIDGLLDLARIEAGRMELSFTGVSLNEIVTGSVASFQSQALRGRIVLRTSFGSKLPRVVADETSVRQIVQNLLANAVGFTPPGGQVIISTTLMDTGELAFRVRDTGVGMSRDEIVAALEPLRRASPRQGKGFGLGLPLTKALVEANRGELQITSAPRQGTLVEVLFPSTRVLAG